MRSNISVELSGYTETRINPKVASRVDQYFTEYPNDEKYQNFTFYD